MLSGRLTGSLKTSKELSKEFIIGKNDKFNLVSYDF